MRNSQKSQMDPTQLRGVFGANLRKLASRYPSVAGLCRELGINRTQFNRYLGGESFPRPDVLHRICDFFDVDARILLEPVDTLQQKGNGFFNHPAIDAYLSKSSKPISESELPSGFYHFSRPSFVEEDRFASGLFWVFREDGFTFVRGYEARGAMEIQGLKQTSEQREYRGAVLRQDQGLTFLIARRGATTCSYSFVTRLASFNNNYWEGYSTRTVGESLSERRVARLVYEHIDFKRALSVVRKSGLVTKDELPSYHARLLRTDQPFR